MARQRNFWPSLKNFVSRSPFIQVLRRRINVAEVGPMEAFKTPLQILIKM